jgi:transposase-like protein
MLRHAEEVTGNVARTCRYYGISRQCFYKWLHRYEEHGEDGHVEESRHEAVEARPRSQHSYQIFVAYLPFIRRFVC